MNHDYYKEYYDLERSHWWFKAREVIIKNNIKSIVADSKKAKPLEILNIGCSTGRSSEYLSEFGEVTSIEYDEFCCVFAREKTGLEIIHGSITELPFAEKAFDLVCAFDVVEHVEDHQLAVNEMKRVAKENATIFITVPAFMSLWSHHDEINHHFRRYRKGEIEKLFEKENDGKREQSTYFNFFLFPPIYLFRRISSIFKFAQKRKGAGSDFEAFNPGLINTLLFQIMKFESFFVTKNITLPFGVSILYSWKKKQSNENNSIY
jgi:SAM-dependent methyltransferase